MLFLFLFSNFIKVTYVVETADAQLKIMKKFDLLFAFCLHSISGEKISPIEVDAVLLSHPDIAQAVAFGVPDDKYGEEVKLLKIKNLTYSFVLTNVFFYIINVNDPTRAPVMWKWSHTRCLHKHIDKMVTKYLKPHFHTSYIHTFA